VTTSCVASVSSDIRKRESCLVDPPKKRDYVSETLYHLSHEKQKKH
jgi:hypothetical protein